MMGVNSLPKTVTRQLLPVSLLVDDGCMMGVNSLPKTVTRQLRVCDLKQSQALRPSPARYRVTRV